MQGHYTQHKAQARSTAVNVGSTPSTQGVPQSMQGQHKEYSQSFNYIPSDFFVTFLLKTILNLLKYKF